MNAAKNNLAGLPALTWEDKRDIGRLAHSYSGKAYTHAAILAVYNTGSTKRSKNMDANNAELNRAIAEWMDR